MKHKELISYLSLDVDSLSNQIDRSSASLVEDPSLNIELQGNDLIALAEAFLFWNGKVSEITYRPSSSQKALVIFSRLNSDDFLRPDDVIAPLLWPEEKLVSFSKSQKNDEKKEITLQLDIIYFQDKEQRKSDLPSFLEQLYAINPVKEKVVLEGKVPPYVFLLTVDWFSGRGKSKTLFYHTDKLV